MITRVKNIINGRKVSQIRHDHFMDRSELSLLVGIKESQLVALENETDNEFVDVDHRMDCARRIALFFGSINISKSGIGNRFACKSDKR